MFLKDPLIKDCFISFDFVGERRHQSVKSEVWEKDILLFSRSYLRI